MEQRKVALTRGQLKQQRLRDKDEHPRDLDAQKHDRPQVGGRARLQRADVQMRSNHEASEISG